MQSWNPWRMVLYYLTCEKNENQMTGVNITLSTKEKAYLKYYCIYFVTKGGLCFTLRWDSAPLKKKKTTLDKLAKNPNYGLRKVKILKNNLLGGNLKICLKIAKLEPLTYHRLQTEMQIYILISLSS